MPAIHFFMNVMFGIDSIYVLYLALSGLTLSLHQHKRLTPFVGVFRPFRAKTYAYCSFEQIVSIIAPKTSEVDTAHSLKNTLIQALKGRNTFQL